MFEIRRRFYLECKHLHVGEYHAFTLVVGGCCVGAVMYVVVRAGIGNGSDSGRSIGSEGPVSTGRVRFFGCL